MIKKDFVMEYYTNGRPYGIKNIIVHHMGGILTASVCASTLNNRGVSAHYCIGSDNIVGTLVEENKRAWHAGDGIGVGSKGNDKGIGIEVSNDATGGNWHVADKQFNTLVELVREIAVRNNLLPLVVGKNLYGHRDCVATTCPGNYLYAKLSELASKVNNYGKTTTTATTTTTANTTPTTGDSSNSTSSNETSDASSSSVTPTETIQEATESTETVETTIDTSTTVTSETEASSTVKTSLLASILSAIIKFIKAIFNKEIK